MKLCPHLPDLKCLADGALALVDCAVGLLGHHADFLLQKGLL